MQWRMVAAWRELWSATKATSSPTTPFGLVTIAPGGSEGAGYHLSAFRWAQTANYGTLPNKLMPRTFAAQAYDLRDPWAGPGSGNYGRCTFNKSIHGYCGAPSTDPESGKLSGGNACCNCGGPPFSDPKRCAWSDDLSLWNANLAGLAPLIRNNSQTNFFMGPIHPRLKSPVGQRLAQGMAAVGYGQQLALSPVISGCAVSGKSIKLTFNSSLLMGDKLVITPAGRQNTSVSNPLSSDSMLMQVCVGDKADCACLSWKQIGKKGPEFCEIPADGGPPGPVRNTSAHPTRMDRWFGVPIQLAGDNGISVDLSLVNTSGGGVSAIKFGWGWNSMDCCTSPQTAAGYAPCIPGSCGIMSAKSLLPINPFFATLTVAGKCRCPAPQVCDE